MGKNHYFNGGGSPGPGENELEIIPQVETPHFYDCRYRREDVTVLRTPRGWMQKGRRVMDKETWMKKRSDCNNKNKQHNQANSKKTHKKQTKKTTTKKNDNNQQQNQQRIITANGKRQQKQRRQQQQQEQQTSTQI